MGELIISALHASHKDTLQEEISVLPATWLALHALQAHILHALCAIHQLTNSRTPTNVGWYAVALKYGTRLIIAVVIKLARDVHS